MSTETDDLKPYLQCTYLAESLDPIHIGTGEFQLGRVDNTVVREAGTNLPKVPGSSIAGVARAYSAMAYGKYRRQGDGKSCAGKGGEHGEDHCGESTCRICTTYGFSKERCSFQGLAQTSDAHILFFPVYSAVGPLWVTCPSCLEAAGCSFPGLGTTSTVNWNQAFSDIGDRVVALGRSLPDPINLGWLYLEQYMTDSAGRAADWTMPVGSTTKKLGDFPCLAPVLDRLVMVGSDRFSSIVEDQLEVRTSVSISPFTGAAEVGALFTSEAIPRATFLYFQITYLQPEFFWVPKGKGLPPGKIEYDGKPASLAEVERTVWSGLRMTEYLGMGGMNTRGFGRLRIIR